MYYSTTCPSPVGTLTLACDGSGENLVGLWIEGQKYHGGSIAEAMLPRDGMKIFAAARRWLDRYFAGERPAPHELLLAPAGSRFRQEVWEILCGIPYGEVITYKDIAGKIAADKKSMSIQAVGGAVGHNPISIIIPCHRVVGTNGSLTGYAGGIETKVKLLEWEGADISRLFVPKKGTAL